MDDLGSWADLLATALAERLPPSERICELCVEMLDVSGGGISMVTTSGHRGVLCATDDISARLEDLQLTLGEGPCIDAVHSGVPVCIPDLHEPSVATVERWPGFLEGASAAGARAVFAFPLRIGAISVGAMDLYRERPGELDAQQFSAALMAADAAALALLRIKADPDVPFADELAEMPPYQPHVHQATGMVQVQLGITTEDAFLMLRARAFSTGRPLVELATDVVERRLRFSEEDL